MKTKDKTTIDMFSPEASMIDAKRVTMEAAGGKGTSCPCCGQFVKIYNRTITSTMARQLIHAWHSYGTRKYFHVKNVVMGGSSAGDFTKLEFWGLVVRQYHMAGEEGKRTSGFWAITQKGEDFIHSRTALPKYAMIYNSQFLEYGGNFIFIRDALGQRFNYTELMGSIEDLKK